MPSRNAVNNFIHMALIRQLLKTSLVCMMDAFKASGDPRPPSSPRFPDSATAIAPPLKKLFLRFPRQIVEWGGSGGRCTRHGLVTSLVTV